MDISNDSSLIWKTEPYDFQLEILKRTYNKPYWGLFMEMGLGKSKILIDTFQNLYLMGEVDAVLYMAKKGEFHNFQSEELPKHKLEHLQCIAMSYLGAHRKLERQKLSVILKPSPKLRILSMNIEAVRSQTGVGFAISEAFVKSTKKCMLILDESTCVKDKNSSQHKSIKKLRAKCKYARISTGTVMPRDPVDLYCQAEILGRGLTGHLGITSFRSDYLIKGKPGKFRTPTGELREYPTFEGPKNLEKLRKIQSTFATVLEAKDAIGLPDAVYQTKHVPLTDRQIELYRKMTDFAVLEFDGEFVTASNALSLENKLHQIVCGQLKTEDGYMSIENNRIPMIREMVEEALPSRGPVIIWSFYSQLRRDLETELKKICPVTHLKAGLDPDTKSQMLTDWKTSAEPGVLLASQTNSGYGLTLVESNTNIIASESDNYEQRLQLEKRTLRIGQTESVLYVTTVSKGTMETKITERNRNKAWRRSQVVKTEDWLKSLMLKDH